MEPDRRPRPRFESFRRFVLRRPDPRPDHDTPASGSTPQLEAPKDPPVELPSSIEVDDKQAVKPPSRLGKWVVIVVVTIALAGVAAAVAGIVWYQQQLAPVSDDTTKHVRVEIVSGMTPAEIATALKDAGVVRSSLAFSIYAKISRAENNLKAGIYNLQPSLSTPGIVSHLVAGKQDTFDVTFLPGDTLENDRQKLIDVGYAVADVDAALSNAYDRPLFAGKPAGTDLEGYLYGETLEFDSSATPEKILGRFFDEYEAAITDNNLVAGFKKQGLTLYEGITLASIVQREMSSHTSDMPQIARVFLNRMKAGMTLGSDVTYQYGAKKLGVAPTPTLDSPYNTRIHQGLPPGPIATPGLSALKAVANPASNNYLYFLSGDDEVTYFATTDVQHQQNIAAHCQKKCAIN